MADYLLLTPMTASILHQRSWARSDIEQLSCTGSSLISEFKPSPCPSHYAGHLAAMPSADFFSIAGGVIPIGAIGVHLVHSQPPMATAAPRLDRPEA